MADNTPKKQYYRQIKNGKVVFIDAATGNIINDLSGYVEISEDGPGIDDVNGVTNPVTTPVTPTETKTKRRGQSDKVKDMPDNYWDNYTGSRGTGSLKNPGGIVTDFQTAFGNLAKNIEKFKNDVIYDIANKATGGKLEEAIDTTKQQAADLGGQIMGGLDNMFGGAISNITGNKDTQVAENEVNPTDPVVNNTDNLEQAIPDNANPVSQDSTVSVASLPPIVKEPQEVISYIPSINNRKLPVTPEWMTKAAAAAQATDPNLTLQIISGGQVPKSLGAFTNSNGETYTADQTNPDNASDRHNIDPKTGLSDTADIKVFLNGQEVNTETNKDIVSKLITNFAAVGLDGIGVANGSHGNFIHAGTGNGEPAIWAYGPGVNNGSGKYLDSSYKQAYDVGIAKKNSGEGQQILQSYVDKVPAPIPAPDRETIFNRNDVSSPTSIANIDNTIDPKLLEAVNRLRVQAGQSIVNSPTEVANDIVNPINPSTNTATPSNGEISIVPDNPMASQGNGPLLNQVTNSNDVLNNTDNLEQTQVPEVVSQQVSNNATNPNNVAPTNIGNVSPSQNPVNVNGVPVNNNISDANTNPSTQGFMDSSKLNINNENDIGNTTTALDAINNSLVSSDPIKMAYLKTLNMVEGSPDFNTTFGGDPIELTGPEHPNIYNAKHDTTAAGYLQFNKPTWDEWSKKAGATDFSNPEDQLKTGWKLAESNYNYNTKGRDLYTDLKNNQVESSFVNNSNRWASLPGGKQPSARYDLKSIVSAYNDNLVNLNAENTAKVGNNISDKINQSDLFTAIDKNQDKGFINTSINNTNTTSVKTSNPNKLETGIRDLSDKATDKADDYWANYKGSIGGSKLDSNTDDKTSDKNTSTGFVGTGYGTSRPIIKPDTKISNTSSFGDNKLTPTTGNLDKFDDKTSPSTPSIKPTGFINTSKIDKTEDEDKKYTGGMFTNWDKK